MHPQNTSRILILWAFSSVASAAPPLAWTHSTGKSDADPLKLSQSCDKGDTVVGGGVLTGSKFMASRSLYANAPDGDDTWRTVTRSVDGAPSEKRSFEVSALCAAPEVAACVEKVEASWDPDTTPEKQVTATCPKGMLAFAGGAEITGVTYGRGFRKLGPGGLFIPTSWVADVEEFADDVSFASDWGVTVVAYCAPAAVFADHVTPLVASFGDGICIDSDCMLPGYDYAADTTYRFSDPDMPDLNSCTEPLSIGMSGDPGRFVVDSGPRVIGGLADSYEGRIGAFKKGVWNNAVGLCADSLSAFGEDLAAYCAAPEPEPTPDPWEIDLSRWAIGGTILYGVVQDGGGVIILPGVGPVPVDPGPGPLWTVEDPLPIVVVPYQSPRTLDALLDRLTGELGEGRVDYTESASVADALRSSELLLVTPEDEAGAVAWLSAYRERLADRDTPVMVFLQQDGAGLEALERW